MATTDQQDSIPLTSQDAVALQGAVTAEAIASVAYTKRTKSFRVGNAEGGVLIGAGIAIGAAVLGKLLTLPFRRGNRQPKQLLTTAHAQVCDLPFLQVRYASVHERPVSAVIALGV